MQFAILHRTEYSFSAPVAYLIQTLHLTPRRERHQHYLRWRISAPGSLSEGVDAFGNVTHVLALTESRSHLAVDARGEIEVDVLRDGLLQDDGELPAMTLAVPTPLTLADDMLRMFAGDRFRRHDPGGALEFARAVRQQIKYAKGQTDVRTSAADALRAGRGVCQDHAHVFIAGCRSQGVPARYVSGYYYAPEAPHAASHAWADVWFEGSGWISIDVTHGCFASDRLCRLAVGRDYDSAAPVRGVRLGGGDEAMSVRVHMRPISVATESGAAYPRH